MDERVTGWRSDKYFSNMESVSKIDDGWRVVVSCSVCFQTWLVDEYDKVQYLFAIKIDDPTDTSSAKFLEIHKRFLTKAHDGETEEVCKMSGCENNTVNDFAFCAKCLIQKQGVYQ